MARVIQDTAGKIRSLPIQAKLETLLMQAGQHCGLDVVRVISGGQAAKGTPGRRTGSTRHDLGWAADLQLELGGRRLSFARGSELPYFESFVSLASQLGATGIGAAVDYMGPLTIHVGYGAEAVWGGGGRVARAPRWLVTAFEQGRKRRGQTLPQISGASPAPGAPLLAKHIVVARSGLNVRSGPSTTSPVVGVLKAGAHVWCDPVNTQAEWRRVDLQNDGLFEGFVFSAYLDRA